MLFLDTDVMVEIIRRRTAARNWLISLPESPGLPGFVLMELISGCRNNKEVEQLFRQVELFQVYWPSPRDCERAVKNYARAHLSHHLDLLDALIGECAVGCGAVLCTFNRKHFKSIPGLVLQEPFERW